MRGLCDERPKPLLPLANRPVLRLIIERLAEAGVSEALVVVGHRLEKIRESLGQKPVPGVGMAYEVQHAINGTGGATMLAEDFAGGEPFVLVFGDVIVHSANYGRAVQLFQEGARAVLSTYDIGEPVATGAVFVENDRVVRIVERPGPQDRSPLVNAGLFVFPPEIFEATRNLPAAPTGEHELTGGIQKLIDNGRTIRAMPVTGFWANLTDPDALIAAYECVGRELVEKGEKLIDDAAEVSPEAIKGETVAIARDARIGDGTVLGRGVSIGQGSVVGSGCILERCIVLENATIGDFAQLENTIIESGASIPPGAVLRSPADNASIIWRTTYR